MSNWGNAGETPADAAGRYFFLSYAHSAPLEGHPETEPDETVSEFFADLTAAVESHPARRPGLRPGFYDQQIPVDGNWKEDLIDALSEAEVFVPLYSPRYLAVPWPGREWACFSERLKRAGFKDPQRRFVPVLWTPLAGEEDPPGLRATLDLDPHAPQFAEDYAENGLRALLTMRRPFRESYEAIVSQVADRIVMATEESVLEPSPVPDIDKVQSAFVPGTPLAVFTVEVAAPTSGTAAAGHDPAEYGDRRTDWRPFPQQELTLAEYAQQVAERFEFEVRISEIGKLASRAQPADGAGIRPTKRRPGIILIDPWLVADQAGAGLLSAAIEKLPRWVLPLVAADRLDDSRTAELTRQVRAILSAAGALPSEAARRAADGVGSLDDFVAKVRELVGEAERQYFRYSSGPPGPGRSKRPRLGDGLPRAPRSAGEGTR